MPYNTRRKSLSLPSLGIQLPQTNASRAANRSPPQAQTNEQPPSKRAKRSHSSPSPPSPSIKKKHERGRSSISYHDHTPPPSPGATSLGSRVDVDGISDEIVVAVIQQLEKTANKPHLVKELAAILCTSLSVVDNSANPQAIISSRLNTYLKRPWTALSPCPLAKELIPTHPRRIYFYLTTCPHQPLPEAESSSPLNSRRSVVSPSVSDEDELRKRVVLSPSPEIDLTNPELDDEQNRPTPAGSFNGSLAPDSAQNAHALVVDPHRAVSPPLEGDEREFTQTASSMQARTMSQVNSPSDEQGPLVIDIDDSHETVAAADVNETEDTARLRNRQTAAALFGPANHLPSNTLSSPALKPVYGPQLSPSFVARKQFEEMVIDTRSQDIGSILGNDLTWANEVRSPENVDLDELDDMLGGYWD